MSRRSDQKNIVLVNRSRLVPTSWSVGDDGFLRSVHTVHTTRQTSPTWGLDHLFFISPPRFRPLYVVLFLLFAEARGCGIFISLNARTRERESSRNLWGKSTTDYLLSEMRTHDDERKKKYRLRRSPSCAPEAALVLSLRY